MELEEKNCEGGLRALLAIAESRQGYPRDHKVIEEVSDLWHGSDDFVSFRGSLFHIPRTVACETSSRSSCIFLPPSVRLGFPLPFGDRLIFLTLQNHIFP